VELQPPTKVLRYVGATGADEKLLLGRSLERVKEPPKPKVEGEEAEEESEEDKGKTEWATFTAIDQFRAGALTAPYHVASAVQSKAVKFWYIPRTGDFAVMPFVDPDGDVAGVLCMDTVGLDRSLTPEELEMLGSLAATTGVTVQRVENAIGEANYNAYKEMEAAYTEGKTELEKELEDAAAVEKEEGGDKLASSKAKCRRAAADCGSLTGDKLTFIETRRKLKGKLKPVLNVIKAVQAIVQPSCVPQLDKMEDWDKVKAAISLQTLAWGDDLFAKIGSCDVAACTAADKPAFEKAEALISEEEDGVPLVGVDAVKETNFISFLALTFVKEATTLFKAKIAQDEAEAAAAAAAPPVEE